MTYPFHAAWHCPSCEVQWTAARNEPCFVCGRPAAKGPYLNRNGKQQPRTTSMTWEARIHEEATV